MVLMPFFTSTDIAKSFEIEVKLSHHNLSGNLQRGYFERNSEIIVFIHDYSVELSLQADYIRIAEGLKHIFDFTLTNSQTNF